MTVTARSCTVRHSKCIKGYMDVLKSMAVNDCLKNWPGAFNDFPEDS